MHNRKLVFISLITTIILWGSSFPSIKVALLYYSPGQVATLRFLFASFSILLLSYKSQFRVPRLREVPLFLFLSLIGVFGYHLLLNYGESLTNAGTAGFMVNIAPIFSLLLCSFFFKEKLTFIKIIGTGISLFGVWLIIKSNGMNFIINTGIIYLILAALAWSLFFIIQKILLQKYSSIETTCYGIWTATLMFFILNDPIVIIQHSIEEGHISAFIACAYLGIFSTSIAYWLWAYTLKNMDVSTVSIYTYCVPFISAILAYYFINERYSDLFLLGGIFVILGMIVANHLNALKKISGYFRSKLMNKKIKI